MWKWKKLRKLASSPSQDNAASSAAGASSSITPAMLQQAMQMAMGGAGGASAGAASTNRRPPAAGNEYDHLLPELHVVGFLDDAENRLALAATGGNVEASLVWIIDRREQMEADLD